MTEEKRTMQIEVPIYMHCVMVPRTNVDGNESFTLHHCKNFIFEKPIKLGKHGYPIANVDTFHNNEEWEIKRFLY